MASELSRARSSRRYFYNILALYKQRKDLRIYLELLLSIIAIALFVAFAIKPTLVTIGDLFSKIQEEQRTSDALDTKIKNLGIAQTLYNNESQNISLLNLAIPDSPDVAGYARQIEAQITKENLQEINISADKTDLITTASQNSMNITITVSGDFAGCQNFIKDIENLRRPSVITNLDFAKADKNLNLTVTVKVPYL